MSYNPMSVDDTETIKWLEERSNSVPALGTAWNILKKYYDECKNHLKNIDERVSPFKDIREKSIIYNLVSEVINNNTFMLEVEEFLGVKKEEILDSIKNRDNEWMIAKIARLYNMRLKLGHSARITYIAEEELKNTPKCDNYDLLQRTVLLSALLHDVGRFYQASNYNDLFDSNMKKEEKKIGDLDVDHAVAGYYYSLSSALELHKLTNYNNDEELFKYISEAVASVVVKCHQKSNSLMDYFDYSGSYTALNSSTLLNDLYDFIGNSYEDAKLMNYDVSKKIDSKHKEFIDNFINNMKRILFSKEIDTSYASGFEYDHNYFDYLYLELGDEIKEVMNNSHGLSLDEASDKIVNIINNKINSFSQSKLTDEEISSHKKTIIDLLSGMVNYDIATSIENTFQKNVNIPNGVRFLISSSMSMTMDADKIDILNQRALGIYNTSYYVDSFEVFPPDGMSLRDILNNYFKFNLGDEFVVSSELINVFNNMNDNIKNMIHDRLGNIDIFDINRYPIGTKVKIDNNNVIIDGNVYQNDSLNSLFNDNWNDYLIKNLNLEKTSFKEFKSKYIKDLQISISRSDFDKNIKNYSITERRNAYKKLLISDNMEKRFKLEGNNRIGNGWIIDSENSDHLVHSSISGLIWQLNQFLMVNMRNKHSYEFIEKNHILDQIYDQYLHKDPDIAYILKDYIDYCKKFMNVCLNKVNSDTLTKEDLELIRKDVYNESLLNKDISLGKVGD